MPSHKEVLEKKKQANDEKWAAAMKCMAENARLCKISNSPPNPRWSSRDEDEWA